QTPIPKINVAKTNQNQCIPAPLDLARARRNDAQMHEPVPIATANEIQLHPLIGINSSGME
ncbi:hypothetical protein, partial [Acidocella sp.]|uniref:hypothetical protein n=1 Tax=Acidocella sp. TaxID=50710 RepID=UPI0026061C3A